MKSIFFGILCFTAMNCLPAYASNEPQTLDPAQDAKLISRLRLWTPGSPVPDIFNILVIGQDDPANKRNPRAPLSSRSDIIMLLSMNRRTNKFNILSVYRDHSPAGGCEDRIGPAPNDKVNGVYSIGGRSKFIPCIEGMLEEMVAHLPRGIQNDVLEYGRIHVHALFEGTRSQTISPLGKDIVSVVSNNKWAFVSTYGVGQTAAALSVIVGQKLRGTGISYLLGSNLSEDEVKKMQESKTDEINSGEKISEEQGNKNEQILRQAVNPRYLTVELKERHIYPAGGYQRAFNLATSLVTILGWAGYGIDIWKNQNYDFLGRFFGDAINNNMSHSVDFHVLEKEVFMKDGKHLLTTACYSNGSSPIRIIQWGESAGIYSIYENGYIRPPRQSSMLRQLKFVDILPEPSNCGS